MSIPLPELSLVVLVGPSGAGKSTFARRWFLPTEVVSSDHCRALVCDDETDQSATDAAFEVLYAIARKRLEKGRLTVVDATNVLPESRKKLVALAREHDVLATAVVFDLPEAVCHARNQGRPNRVFGLHVVRRQSESLRRSLRGLEREGFRHVHVFRSEAEAQAAEVVRTPLWSNLKHEHGPFDVVGDVHGCFDELAELLEKLGYRLFDMPDGQGKTAEPPPGRKLVFVGDLVDRGPKSPEVLELAMNMAAAGTALCVPGNHEERLSKKLRGRDVKVGFGLQQTLEQLSTRPPEFVDRVKRFLDCLVSHYVLDAGKLVVAHAGMKEAYIGRASGRVRSFALYGETTGELDESGHPTRIDWAAEYRGKARVVYGHTPVEEPRWVNLALDVDTGCVFGGRLTALRYPELECVDVPARAVYSDLGRPLARSRPGDDGGMFDVSAVLGRRHIQGGPIGTVLIPAERAPAALEFVSRFAAAPHWLVYLPPTTSPSETSREPGFLEHPREALAYYAGQGVETVVCQEKHMGSRAVAIVCRDHAAAKARFGAAAEGPGAILTRTGRRFFDGDAVEMQLVDRLRARLTECGWWERFQTSWFFFDCELMPWSAKAQELLRRQYAAVGAAATSALQVVCARLEAALATEQAAAEGIERPNGAEPDSSSAAAKLLEDQLKRFRGRESRAAAFVEAYRRYCWPTEGLSGLRLAPFHLLASEGKVHMGPEGNHVWQMERLDELAETGDGALLQSTRRLVVSPGDPADVERAVQWWTDLTASGGEGMVVKPLHWLPKGPKGFVQPGLKCRGREYLRIIYGPDYDLPEHLDRLRKRGLGAKRSLALREFSLGATALQRFVEKDSARRVHECVFGVLALESEPIDPRL